MPQNINQNNELLHKAKKVLSNNNVVGRIIPAQGLYPHCVLWDSCFIATGLSHYDLKLAKAQVEQFFSAQWQDGMVPNILFNKDFKYFWDRWIWRSWISPNAQAKIPTSGITQPPMLAEAIVRIGKQLAPKERALWYKSVIEHLIAYHSWLYEYRDLSHNGLITLIHPWETGLDNTPPWLASLRHQHNPFYLNLIGWLKIDKLADHLRIDAHYVDPKQRSTTLEALRLYDALRLIRRKRYDNAKILKHPTFAIEDIAYNSIFIRANTHLRDIADTINYQLPECLIANMRASERNLNQLWDDERKSFYSRSHKTKNLLREDSIASLLPLYSGAITKTQADLIVKTMQDQSLYQTKFPLPSVPINSSWFKPMRYWQGPTWININWLLIDGLERYGYKQLASELSEQTIKLVKNSGFNEYFNPIDGCAAGVHDFSWTAALIIDLLSKTKGE